MLVKIHKSYRDAVAVCDKEILGRRFEQGNKQLDVKESFFLGDEIEENSLVDLMKDLAKEDVTFNIVGSKSVKAALKAGIINNEGVKRIQGIPFALVLL